MYCHLPLAASRAGACPARPRRVSAHPRSGRADGPEWPHLRAAPFLLSALRRDRLPLLARGDPTHEASDGRAPGGWCARSSPSRRARSRRRPGRGAGRPQGEVRRALEAARGARRLLGAHGGAGAHPGHRSTAPFFRISPALPGRFRWSGTRTLDLHSRGPRAAALRHALRGDVDADARRRCAGRRLARPYTFSFTTPTLRLLQTDWYRGATAATTSRWCCSCASTSPSRTRRLAAAPGRRASSRTRSRRPRCPPGAARGSPPIRPRCQAFAAKVARARSGRGEPRRRVAVRPAADWDKKAYPARRRPARLRDRPTCPPPDAWIRVAVGARRAGRAGRRRRPARRRSTRSKLEPTFFVDGLPLPARLRPRRLQPAPLPRPRGACARSRRAVQAVDVTDPATGSRSSRAPRGRRKPARTEPRRGRGVRLRPRSSGSRWRTRLHRCGRRAPTR